MCTQLTKNVSDLVAGDVYFVVNKRFEILEIECPKAAPKYNNETGEYDLVDVVPVLIEGETITGWDELELDSTVCVVSYDEYTKLQAQK